MAQNGSINLASHESTLRTHKRRARFVMHGTIRQSELVMRLLTMIMHFHSAVTVSPGAIFRDFPVKDGVM